MKARTVILTALAVPLLAGILVAGAFMAGLRSAVSRVPDSTFTHEGIRKILSRESVVLYADGKTRVGTFFEDAHRDYLPYDSIPPLLVEALVSAEDRNFWTHWGWDFKAFLRAMIDNVRSGGRWRGGSTLTQQTAKNLFGRAGPVRGKVDELVNAWRLEQRFTKKEILEFYLNQFFVVGNGHGVRIAARYFFDKEPRDLTLVECAFIAGSVKGPNQYNPFIQGTPERREAALARARARTAYVLRQLRRHGKIGEAQYREALATPLEFRRGHFRFTLSTNMMKVKSLLDSPEMQAILERYGVEDYTAAGLQIHTTLDPEIQRAAEYAVYSNLSALDQVLRDYEPPRDTAPARLSRIEPGTFARGRIVEVTPRRGPPEELRVSFGAVEGVVRKPALEAFFRRWNRHRTGADALPSPAAMADFAARHFRPGAIGYFGAPYLPPEARERGETPDSLLEIAQVPELQGAAQVTREGRVIANVGGFGNTGYDRVNQARRQFGSSFKPVVYAAALELGWHPLDPIPNRRQPFQLGNLVYIPKPDHPPEDTVSLAWAGRRSENIASVRLLYRLFDKTGFDGFWQVCRSLGVSPDHFPDAASFERFVRDSLGVVLGAEHLRELRYQQAVSDLAIDLTFDGRIAEADRLKELPYGIGFARERENLLAGDLDDEGLVRLQLLSRDFLSLSAAANAWRNNDPEWRWVAARSYRDGRFGLFRQYPGPAWRPIPLIEAVRAPDESLLVEGEVSLETLRLLEERLRYATPVANRYSRENLYASKDFRAAVALRYVVELGRRLDIRSPLDPVLSFPLGVNVITLGEAVNAYQAFQKGVRYRTRFGHPQLYVTHIATSDGRVIFEDEAEPEEVLSERTRNLLEAILGSVVQGGTGQRVARELTVSLDGARVPVPAYGKTGTTNDYRNAAFLGYIAGPAEGGFDPGEGYAIGVYTGFDDNRPMTGVGLRGTGASMALPAWLDIAKGIVSIRDYAGSIAREGATIDDSDAPPLARTGRYKLYRVSRRTGLPLAPAADRENPAYAEDLSDELGPNGNAEPPGSYSRLWIREDRED